MLITPAFAQAVSGSTMTTVTQFAPLVLIFAVFYFLLIRPQQQKQKQLQKQLSDLRRGDNVVTSGGIIGTVARIVNDDEVLVEIAEGVRARVVRSTITGLTGKGEPRSDVKAAPDNVDGDSKAPGRTTRRGKAAPANESKPQA
jgi:preprotein translocase subunit YajC